MLALKLDRLHFQQRNFAHPSCQPPTEGQPAAHKKNAQEEEDMAETQEVTARDFHDKGKTKKMKRLF